MTPRTVESSASCTCAPTMRQLLAAQFPVTGAGAFDASRGCFGATGVFGVASRNVARSSSSFDSSAGAASGAATGFGSGAATGAAVAVAAAFSATGDQVGAAGTAAATMGCAGGNQAGATNSGALAASDANAFFSMASAPQPHASLRWRTTDDSALSTVAAMPTAQRAHAGRSRSVASESLLASVLQSLASIFGSPRSRVLHRIEMWSP